MIVTAENDIFELPYHYLPNDWPKKRKKNPDPLMLAVKHGMSQRWASSSCHIAREKDDG